jgi:hypothetical protein
MEGRVQGTVDLCPRYPERQSATYTTEVSPHIGITRACLNFENEAILKRGNLSQTLATPKSYCRMLDKRCYASSLVIPLEHLSSKTLPSMRYSYLASILDHI